MLLLKICVSFALVVVLLSRAGVDAMLSTLGAADRGWLGAGLALGTLAACLQANQWRGLMSAMSLESSYLTCLRWDTAGRFFDAALPTSIGGDVVRASLAAQRRTDRSAAVLSVVLRRIASLPGLVLVVALTLGASWRLPYGGRLRLFAGVCVLGGVGALVVVAAGLRWRSVFVGRLPRVVRGFVEALVDSRSRSTRQRAPFLRAALRGVVFWIVVVLSQSCFLHAVHVHAPLAYGALAITTVNALSLLPISLGGYGLREGAFSAFLTAGGLATTAQGVAVGVCLSAQTLLFGLVGGLVYLTIRSRTQGRTVHFSGQAPEALSASTQSP